MMWKKAQSKFKNASPDDVNRHPSCRLSYSADCIAAMSASLEHVAWSTEDGSVSVAPADFSSPARRLPGAPVAHALQFSPFRSDSSFLGILSSSTLHLFADIDASPACLSLSLSSSGRAGLVWNGSAPVVAAWRGEAAAVATAVGGEVWSAAADGQVLGAAWSPDGGSLAVLRAGDGVQRCDPRAPAVSEMVKETGLGGEGRILWSAEETHIIVSGADKTRDRQVKLFDVRAPASPMGTFPCGGRGHSAVELLYDPDTGMLLSFARGDTAIAFSEVLSEGADALSNRGKSMFNGSVSAAALLPRLGLDLMACEVERLYVACGEKIVQARYRVPRKSYNEFYPDVFEMSAVGEPAATEDEWKAGTSYLRKRAHLTPQSQARLLASDQPTASAESPASPKTAPTPAPALSAAPTADKPSLPARRVVTIDPGSKFKHTQGVLAHKSKHVSLGRALEQRVAPECDMVIANGRYVGYPVVGAGAVELYDLRQEGRVVLVENGSALQAFALDWLQESRLAVGCSDGGVRVWSLPDDGDFLQTPDLHLRYHQAKVTHLLFHRTVLHLLLSVSHDGCLLLWNLLDTSGPLVELSPGERLTAVCWSPDGDGVAAVDASGRLRVWSDAREDTATVGEVLTAPGRNARVSWLQDGVLVVSGFAGHKRLLAACRTEAGGVVETDRCEAESSTPSVMTLSVDVDKMLVLGVGRGDTKVRVFDLADGKIAEGAAFSSETQLQGLCLHSPLACDVLKHEVAIGFLLTQSALQPTAFVVPRVKTDLFHDDLFPSCSAMPAGDGQTTAAAWAAGETGRAALRSLRPEGMPLYSEWRLQEEARRRERAAQFTPRTEAALSEPTEKERQAALVQSMQKIIDSNALKYGGKEENEGVDSDEWDED